MSRSDISLLFNKLKIEFRDDLESWKQDVVLTDSDYKLLSNLSIEDQRDYIVNDILDVWHESRIGL